MADDFLGSVAQEDVEFITEIVKTVNPGDNYKHLAVYTDSTQIVSGATLSVIKDQAGVAVGHGVEVTAANYKDYAAGQLLVWLTDYFTAGGAESVYIYQTDSAMTEANLTALFNATHQLAYFKTVCVAYDDEDAEDDDPFQLDPSAATWLATLCSTDELLSCIPFYPLNTALSSGVVTDVAYVAVEAANKDAWWVYHQVQEDGSVHHGGLVALGLALAIYNDTGTPVGNSVDMVATTAIKASGVNGNALDVTTQSILKEKNISYFKPVGDGTGSVDLYGAKSSQGKVIPAYWIVTYCNYVNKVFVANYMSRRNVYKNAVTYNVLISILIKTVSKFVTIGRIEGFSITAPAYADLPDAAGDEIVVPNAWTGTYKDDLRKVKVYGTLVM